MNNSQIVTYFNRNRDTRTEMWRERVVSLLGYRKPSESWVLLSEKKIINTK